MKIKLVVIRSPDIHQSVKFYENLGLIFQYHRHGKGSLHYSTEIKDTVFEIYPLLKSQEKADISTRLGFEVESLDDLCSQLKLEGFTVLKEPVQSEWGYFAIVKDVDGRKIELTQRND